MTTYIFAIENLNQVSTIAAEHFFALSSTIQGAKDALEIMKAYIASQDADNFELQAVVSEIDTDIIADYTAQEIYEHILRGASFDGIFAKELKRLYSCYGYTQQDFLQEFDRFIEVELIDGFALIF